jgi:hypothetical protein
MSPEAWDVHGQIQYGAEKTGSALFSLSTTEPTQSYMDTHRTDEVTILAMQQERGNLLCLRSKRMKSILFCSFLCSCTFIASVIFGYKGMVEDRPDMTSKDFVADFRFVSAPIDIFPLPAGNLTPLSVRCPPFVML